MPVEAPEFLRWRLDQTRFPADFHYHRAPFANITTAPTGTSPKHCCYAASPVPVAFQRCRICTIVGILSRCRAAEQAQRVRTADPRLARYSIQLSYWCRAVFASRIAAGSAYTSHPLRADNFFILKLRRAGFEPGYRGFGSTLALASEHHRPRSPLLCGKLLQTDWLLVRFCFSAFPSTRNAVENGDGMDCFALRCALRLSVPAEEGFEPRRFRAAVFRPLPSSTRPSSKRRWTRLYRELALRASER